MATVLILAAVILFGIALFFAGLLGIAKVKLHVDEDPRIGKVQEVLPAANCGGCGFAGCADFAKAVVEERADMGGCPVGGPKTAEAVAAVLGVEVELPTITSKVMLKVPPLTQNGKLFRLAGLGMPKLKGKGRGDLYARLRVKLPEELGEREKKLFEDLRAAGI